jgi:hypothetical protein
VDSRLLDEQNSRMKLFVTTASAASWGSRCSALSQHLFWCKNRYNYGHWSHYSSSLLPRGWKFGSITEKDRIKNASSRSKLGSELQETRKRKGGRHSRLFFGKVCLSFKKGADNILPSCGNQNKKSSFGKNQYILFCDTFYWIVDIEEALHELGISRTESPHCEIHHGRELACRAVPAQTHNTTCSERRRLFSVVFNFTFRCRVGLASVSRCRSYIYDHADIRYQVINLIWLALIYFKHKQRALSCL